MERGGALKIWREDVSGEAEVRERCADGWPALLAHGRTRYLAGWPDEAAMRRLLGEAAREAGIETVPLPGAVRLSRFDGALWAVNYGLAAASVPGHVEPIPACGVARLA